MTQKENQKFADDFAFDFSSNFDKLKKHLDDCAVVLSFDTFEEYEVFRDECNRLKELEQSQIKQIKELKQSQKKLAYDELVKIWDNFKLFENFSLDTKDTLVKSTIDISLADYLNSRIGKLRGDDNE